MIILREKNYSKEKLIRRVITSIKNNPLAAIGTVSSVGFGGFNAGIAIKRSRNEKKFQKDQLEATNRLTELLSEDNSSTESKKKNLLKKNKRILKRSQKPYTRDYYLPKPIENIKDNTLDKLNKN